VGVLLERMDDSPDTAELPGEAVFSRAPECGHNALVELPPEHTNLHLVLDGNVFTVLP